MSLQAGVSMERKTTLFFSFRSVLILSASLGYFYYLLRRPYPGIAFLPEDVWRIKLLAAASKSYSFIVRMCEKIGWSSEIAVLRRLYHFEALLLARKPKTKIHKQDVDLGNVRCVLYRKASWVPTVILRPCVIYLHGGGWVFTTVEERDAHHRHIVDRADVNVVAVEYRKAPEHPFPAAFNDCYNAVKFIHSTFERFGVDKDRISLCGDSAGGNLAAAVATRLRDEGLNLLKHQILIYPGVQFITFSLNSHLRKFPLLSKEDCVWCMLTYLGESQSLAEVIYNGNHISEDLLEHPAFFALERYQSTPFRISKPVISSTTTESSRGDSVHHDFELTRFREKIKDPSLCPLMAASMRGLPTTLLLLCDFDVLLDDGLVYADRLKSDNVPVTVITVPGHHGCFRNFQSTKCGALMMDHLVGFLRANL
ncbi:hypothetical protein RvY_02248 [Ramazzottius varieornatus]|uniref:Alpha/beta hydrolase fold-3 domain-containing protein n=1 Tax=Ramazzottius varieornatus TaxID=947166 RepID=A0A1D1UJ51_RAMVA|nr:hypothetical protein RvY_02248 [Ramazzottius varieornatus]